jgi:hypothetical protein
MSLPFDPSDDETWHGGYYEAAMIVGGVSSPGSDERLLASILSLWSSPTLRVAAIGNRRAWQWADAPSLQAQSLDNVQRIYGVLEEPAIGTLPFTSVVVREEGPGGEDWLYASVPMGGLNGGGYPFLHGEQLAESRVWREPLEKALADLVLRVCDDVAIRIAAIGFEIAGVIEVDPAVLAPRARRYVGYVSPQRSGYHYWPTTIWSDR